MEGSSNDLFMLQKKELAKVYWFFYKLPTQVDCMIMKPVIQHSILWRLKEALVSDYAKPVSGNLECMEH